MNHVDDLPLWIEIEGCRVIEEDGRPADRAVWFVSACDIAGEIIVADLSTVEEARAAALEWELPIFEHAGSPASPTAHRRG